MRTLTLVLGAATAAALTVVPGADRADGACAAVVYRQGAPYYGTGGPLPAGNVGTPVGAGFVPQCVDTVPAPPAVPPTRVGLDRVVGVSPRLAVAAPRGSDAALHIRDGVSCEVADPLRCLRRLTRLERTGPALIAPLSALPGARIPVSVRAPGRTVRPAASITLQRFTSRAEWETVARIPTPDARRVRIRLPAVEPGLHRLVRVVVVPGAG
ncbi:MAG: hypothetical protein AB7V62_16190, partial [Thermoleophilia bacterium]